MKNDLAHPLVRLLASGIDTFLGASVILLTLLTISNAKDVSQLLTLSLNSVIWLVLFWPIIYALLVVYLTTKFGGSLGQIICGIKIVDEENKLLSFKMAFFRTYVGSMVSGMLFGVGYLWMFWDPERRGWHDKISNTFVLVKNKYLA
ncbi:RDD family protein, partial [Candidatus Microgenomates bacterium]|nr:RDD family protein [Candidatus Microgenomates bacterium]